MGLSKWGFKMNFKKEYENYIKVCKANYMEWGTGTLVYLTFVYEKNEKSITHRLVNHIEMFENGISGFKAYDVSRDGIRHYKFQKMSNLKILTEDDTDGEYDEAMYFEESESFNGGEYER